VLQDVKFGNVKEEKMIGELNKFFIKNSHWFLNKEKLS
jgi:hypothetical protein